MQLAALFVASSLASSLAVPAAATATPVAYTVDSSHTVAGFAVRHLMVSNVRGELGKVTGTVVFDKDDPAQSAVDVSIDAKGITTREERRDAHLRSADFFDVENFPKLTFVSKRVELDGGKIAKVIGDLTLHGVTKEVVLKVEDLGRVTDPWGNEKAAFEATARINRTDFGLKWNAALETGGLLVGENVDISLEIEAAAATAATKAA